MPLDFLPVDIDVGQFPLSKRCMELLIALATGQELDHLRVEDRIVGDVVVEVEHGGLADNQGMGVGGSSVSSVASDRFQRRGTVAAQENQVAGPFVQAGQGRRDVGKVA